MAVKTIKGLEKALKENGIEHTVEIVTRKIDWKYVKPFTTGALRNDIFYGTKEITFPLLTITKTGVQFRLKAYLGAGKNRRFKNANLDLILRRCINNN